MSKFLLVGSDPESFVRDSSGNLVSAHNIIPGSKWAPTPTAHGSIQPDNITAEFNSRPASSMAEFVENHKLIIGDLEDVLRPLDLKLDFVASVLASDELLSDPMLRIAGCSEDFNAWTREVNQSASEAYMLNNLRCAGGHLHISFDQSVDDDEARIKFVRALDLVLGVPSVVHDGDNKRRTVYGKAGSFRPKDTANNDPYNGVEYRTLSNFWLRSNELMEFVWKGVELVYHNLDELSTQADHFKDDIIQIINSGNQKEAESFCKNFGIEYA